MPLIFFGLSAGAAAGWWFFGEEPDPAKDFNKTLRTIGIIILAIIAIQFLRGK